MAALCAQPLCFFLGYGGYAEGTEGPSGLHRQTYAKATMWSSATRRLRHPSAQTAYVEAQGFLERFLNFLRKKDVFSLTTDVFLHPAQVCCLDVHNCNRSPQLKIEGKTCAEYEFVTFIFKKIRPWTNHGQTVESTLISVERTLFSMERTLFSVELAPSKNRIFSFILLDVRISAN